nr:hypothetical protein I308_04433 [Cryptococcus tetragattii IND107]
MRIYQLIPLLFAVPSFGSLFGSDSSSSTTSATSSSSSSTTSSDEVAFLQTLQAAEISSMSCLITLVNMTTSSLGSCLALTSLADLISNPSASPSSSGGQDFSGQLSTYLGTVCSSTCNESDLKDGKNQLAAVCDTKNTLVSVLGAVLDNYSSSYRTLACHVY